MATDTATPKLPTELFDEKTLFTLGGATAAIFLIAWVINSFIDCPPAKLMRLITLILSELIAVVIMFRKKKIKAMNYLFTFLNGLLIFINVNGVNQMFYDRTCIPSGDTARHSAFLDLNLKSNSDRHQHAAIFALPGMSNWWPDEKLISQNEGLTKEIDRLHSENIHLRSLMEAELKKEENKLMEEVDSLSNLSNSLKYQLKEKQTQLMNKRDSLLRCSADNKILENRNRELNITIENCVREKNAIRPQLENCNNQKNELNQTINSLRNHNEGLNREKNGYKTQLDQCNNQKAELDQALRNANTQIERLKSGYTGLSLTEHIRQTCNRDARTLENNRSINEDRTPDDFLMAQDFWKSFCSRFNEWIANQR